MAGTLSVGLALIGIILLATSWANKLSVLLLLALGAALLGLWDSHLLAHGLAAARYGLAFVLALWLVHALFGVRRGTAAAATAPTPPAASGTTQASTPTAQGTGGTSEAKSEAKKDEKTPDDKPSGETGSPPPDREGDS